MTIWGTSFFALSFHRGLSDSLPFRLYHLASDYSIKTTLPFSILIMDDERLTQDSLVSAFDILTYN